MGEVLYVILTVAIANVFVIAAARLLAVGLS